MTLTIDNPKIEHYFRNSTKKIEELLEYVVVNNIYFKEIKKEKSLDSKIMDLVGKVKWSGDLEEMREGRKFNDIS